MCAIIWLSVKSNLKYLLFLIIMAEWTIIGDLWKYLFLPFAGSVRPKFQGQPLSLETTGMPSAHTSAVVVALIGAIVALHVPALAVLALLMIAGITMWQRVTYKYHSVIQVGMGVAVGVLDASLWLCLLRVILRNDYHQGPY